MRVGLRLALDAVLQRHRADTAVSEVAAFVLAVEV